MYSSLAFFLIVPSWAQPLDNHNSSFLTTNVSPPAISISSLITGGSATVSSELAITSLSSVYSVPQSTSSIDGSHTEILQSSTSLSSTLSSTQNQANSVSHESSLSLDNTSLPKSISAVSSSTGTSGGRLTSDVNDRSTDQSLQTSKIAINTSDSSAQTAPSHSLSRSTVSSPSANPVAAASSPENKATSLESSILLMSNLSHATSFTDHISTGVQQVASITSVGQNSDQQHSIISKDAAPVYLNRTTIGDQIAITDTEVVTQTVCECSQDKCVTHLATTTVSGKPTAPVNIMLSPTIVAGKETGSSSLSKSGALSYTFTFGDLKTIYDTQTLTQTICKYSQGHFVTQVATTTVSGAPNSPVTLRPSETIYVSQYESASLTKTPSVAKITLGTAKTITGIETITQTVLECDKERCVTHTGTTTLSGRPEKPITFNAPSSVPAGSKSHSARKGFVNSTGGNQVTKRVPAVSTEFRGTYIVTETVTQCCEGKCSSQKKTKTLSASPSMTATLVGIPTTTVKTAGTSTVTIQSIQYSILTSSAPPTPRVTTYEKTLTPSSFFSGTVVTVPTTVTISECNQGKCSPSLSTFVPSGTSSVYLQPTTYVSVVKGSTVTVHSFTDCPPPKATASVTTIVSTIYPSSDHTGSSLMNHISPYSSGSDFPTAAPQPEHASSGLKPPHVVSSEIGGSPKGNPQYSVQLQSSMISHTKKGGHQTLPGSGMHSPPLQSGSLSKSSPNTPPSLQSGSPRGPVDLINNAQRLYPGIAEVLILFHFF